MAPSFHKGGRAAEFTGPREGRGKQPLRYRSGSKHSADKSLFYLYYTFLLCFLHVFLKMALHNFKTLKSNFKETLSHVPTLAHASHPRDCLWKGREDAMSSGCLGDEMRLTFHNIFCPLYVCLVFKKIGFF